MLTVDQKLARSGKRLYDIQMAMHAAHSRIACDADVIAYQRIERRYRRALRVWNGRVAQVEMNKVRYAAGYEAGYVWGQDNGLRSASFDDLLKRRQAGNPYAAGWLAGNDEWFRLEREGRELQAMGVWSGPELTVTSVLSQFAVWVAEQEAAGDEAGEIWGCFIRRIHGAGQSGQGLTVDTVCDVLVSLGYPEYR